MRQQLTKIQSLDDVDFTILAATSVLSDMIENCPPAESCKEAFDRMSKATIKMAMSTTGFGPSALPITQRKQTANLTRKRVAQQGASSAASNPPTSGYQDQSQMPRFDMNLSELFSPDEADSQAINRPSYGLQTAKKPRAGQNVKQVKKQRQQLSRLPTLAPHTAYEQHVQYPSGMTNDMPIDPMQQHQQQRYSSHILSESIRSSAPLYDQGKIYPQPLTNLTDFDSSPSTAPTTGLNQYDPNNPPDLGTQVDIDIDTSLPDFFTYDDYNNDAGIDFNILNSMLGGHMGGANVFDGAGWDERGMWNADGIEGMPSEGVGGEGGSRDAAGAGGQGGGSGSGVDMFGGLFFG
jgi:hypothetical protein